MLNKLRREAEKSMFRQVLAENEREKNGTATAERVMIAMDYIMESDQTVHNEIATVLRHMLGNGPKYSSKTEVWEEALSRLYPHEPETESDDTIDLDSSDETIEVDLDSLD